MRFFPPSYPEAGVIPSSSAIITALVTMLSLAGISSEPAWTRGSPDEEIKIFSIMPGGRSMGLSLFGKEHIKSRAHSASSSDFASCILWSQDVFPSPMHLVNAVVLQVDNFWLDLLARVIPLFGLALHLNKPLYLSE